MKSAPIRDLLKEQIWRTIQRHGPITAKAIAERIPVLTDDPVRCIRKKVRELIVKDRHPIAALMGRPAGYFVIRQKDTQETYNYVLQLRGRIISIAERLKYFKASTARKIQLLLFDEIPDSADTTSPLASVSAPLRRPAKRALRRPRSTKSTRSTTSTSAPSPADALPATFGRLRPRAPHTSHRSPKSHSPARTRRPS